MAGWAIIVTPMLLWAAALWPAVFVADSVDTWNQAIEGPVVNWAPPLYTYFQRLVYHLVGSPSLVVLVQCALLAWAIRRVLDVAVALGAGQWRIYAFGFAVALLPPVGAFPAHIIKDVPYAVGFLLALGWVASEIVGRMGSSGPHRGRLPGELVLFVGLGLMALSRVNGLIVVVVVAAVAFVVARARRAAVAAIAASVVLYVAMTSAIYPALGVVEPGDHFRSFVYLLDLGDLYSSEPSAVPDDAVDDLELYGDPDAYGDGLDCHWPNQPFMTWYYTYPRVSEADLRDAWISALPDHALEFAGNHLCAASGAWRPFPSADEVDGYQTLWNVVVPNRYVFADPLSDPAKRAADSVLEFVGLTNLQDKAWNPTLTHTLLWRASTWMYVLATLLAVGAVRFRRWQPLWLVVPFVAQAASVVAIAGPHYRYMAPAWIGSVILLPTAWRLVRGTSTGVDPDGADPVRQGSSSEPVDGQTGTG